MIIPFDTRIPANPDMLILARQLRGLTQEEVTAKSNIPLERIRQIETDGVLDTRLTWVFAEGYGFPPAFFWREGKLHAPQFPIHINHDLVDDILEPLQQMLDDFVGDEQIANIEMLDGGIFLCRYESDESPKPYSQVKLGDTLKQAEAALRKITGTKKPRKVSTMPNYQMPAPERCWLYWEDGRQSMAECVPAHPDAGVGFYYVRVDRYDMPGDLVLKADRDMNAHGFNWFMCRVHKHRIEFDDPPIGPFRDTRTPIPSTPEWMRGQ